MTKWFWGTKRGPWLIYGLWYKQRWFIGVSIIMEGVWEDK